MLFVLFLSMSILSANEIDDNVTSISDENMIEIVNDIDYTEDVVVSESNILQVSQDSLQSSEDEEIVVDNWEELQYYCAQTDKDYTLKLKENTNFYPIDPTSSSCQIKIKNNVKIIGTEGSWIGDSSKDPRALMHIAISVEDNSKVGLTLENITFKWIKVEGGFNLPDGRFIYIGGKKNTIIKNCQFNDLTIKQGHSCVIHLGKGTAIIDNCSFINCTDGYGVLSVYGSYPHMIVKNCYFEGNYASTEPGCINNCGKLTVYNTTFIKNKSFWWAGAIHTHGGGNTTIYDSSFIDNVAGWNGGALYTYSYLQVYNSVFIGNNCTTDNGGGAIGACQYESTPHIYIEGCLFEDNSNNCWYPDSLSDGPGRGGAISIMDVGSLEVRDTTFIANAAARGTAICALAVQGYGSPDVILVNDSFINHTRVNDVLEIKIWDTSFKNISDNYYLGNSIVFSNLTLVKLSEGREDATLQINASLKNPTYYDDDILDRTLYDVYINSKYVKTVNSTVFSVDFGDLDICDVYVIPTISNRKSNEVTITSTREYVFVSKSNGNDSNNGISRDAPVYSIKRALELANVCQNIILLDGDYSESDVQINYDVTIKGEGNATLTGATSFVGNANFTLKNLKIDNLNGENFIKQNKDNLVISKCIFTNNDAVLVYNNAFASLTNSILLNNSRIMDGNINDCVLDYNWWSNVPSDLGNYVTLNLTSDINALENNQKANVKAVFYLNDGSKYTNLPDINLGVTAFNGVSSQNTVNIDSSFTYTLTAFSDGALTISYNNVNISKSFEFLKSNPSISLTTNDIMFGDELIITVTTPSDAEGNLTVNIGNLSQTKVIQSKTSTFTFENLKADTYTIALTYNGDKKYMTKDLTSSVSVNKYESTTKLNLSTVNVGEDVIITINTISTSTGNVTLSINNNSTTLTLTDSKAEYTIKNIKRGDYLIRAVYNGDDKYLTSQDSKFIEVDNLNATMSIQAEDITYGDAAVIRVTLNDDASGNITVSIDDKSNQSKVSNGRAEVTFTNLEAGSNKNITVFYSGDDTYFNLTKSATFNIAKADLTFTIYSSDIKIGQFGEIVINVPQRTSGTFTIGEDVINIPLSGEISYVIPDLEIGNYTYTATYNGNNYYTVSNTTSFTVSEYPIPQVQNEGFNTQNTHKSQYETSVNGNIAFTIPFDETLSGDLLVDSWGNVYLTTQNGVYAFNQTSQLWYFTSTSAAGNLSGIAIGRDVIIAPKSGDTLYFINQTTGERYGGSNLYQGSSLFAPVVDANATLYIVSEYQYSSEDYKLTIIPYKLWANGGEPTLVSIGNTQPLCSPTLNENIIVVVSDNRLRIIDAKSLQTLAIKTGNYMPIRPIIGDGNVIYAILSDSIVAYNSNGAQVWKTKVTSGAGNILVLDNEQGLYHVNSRGVLYKYDLVDGSQSKFSSLKVTSGVLIDANNNLYFGSNSMFYALDSEGNVLWKSELGSKIIGNPVMDASGLIYVPTENGVTALTYAPLSDPDLKVSVDDIVEGQKATITITWNSQTTGSVSYTVNGEDVTVDAGDAKITKVISGLTNGYYDVSVSYLGDMRFKETSVTKTFVVRSTDDVANNIQFDGNSTFSFSLNNAQGNLTVNVAGKTYTNELTNGQASITIDKLSPGDWDAVVIYSGDRQFNKANRTFSIEIPKYSVELNEVITTENIVSRISVSLPNDATGNLTLSVGTKKYTETIAAGNAVIIVDDLPEGNYSATLAYSGDNNYEGVSKTVSINPAKIKVNLDDTLTVNSTNVSIDLAEDASGNITVVVSGKSYTKELINGKASVEVSSLYPGSYNATVIYSGDGKYDSATKIVNVNVPKVAAELDNGTLAVDGQNGSSCVSIDLPADATGTLTVTVGGKTFTENIVDGKATVDVSGLNPGSYNATVTYSGDGKYASITKTIDVNVPKVAAELDNDTLVVDTSDAASSVSINLPEDATGTLTVSVDGKNYTENLTNGKATVNIPELADGEYNITVTYSGDSKYDAITKTTVVNVNNTVIDNSTNTTGDNSTNTTVKADPVLIISAGDVSVGESVVVNVRTSADTGKLVVNVNDVDYELVISNGESSVSISDLAVGNYTVVARFAGDDKFNEATNSTSFSVLKVTVPVTNETITIPEGDSTEYSVSLPSDATGTLTVTVDGKKYSETLTNGKATVSIPELSEGSHNITVAYSGDSKYSPITKSSVVVKNPANSTGDDNNTNQSVSVPDDALNIPESGNEYSISLPADASGTLTVTVDGVPYSQELVNGKATVTIPELGEGSHNITVTYSGDGKYAPVTKSSVVVKEHVPVIKLTASNLNMLYSSGKYFKVRLTSDGQPLANNKVKITINGKTYTRTTDKNGYASLKISLAPKAYTVKATYGNLTITKKVTVKSIITAKNVNAKKSAKTVKIKVTLKKVNGKYLKKKKVTLKFNKKTFKVKTNKKGVATFTLKNSVYKKLKVNKKYTYQVIYGKDKVKKTIKFKK